MKTSFNAEIGTVNKKTDLLSCVKSCVYKIATGVISGSLTEKP